MYSRCDILVVLRGKYVVTLNFLHHVQEFGNAGVEGSPWYQMMIIVSGKIFIIWCQMLMLLILNCLPFSGSILCCKYVVVIFQM